VKRDGNKEKIYKIVLIDTETKLCLVIKKIDVRVGSVTSNLDQRKNLKQFVQIAPKIIMRNHQTIRSIAERMQTNAEKLIKGELGSPFNSKAWKSRQKAIENKITKRVARVKIRKMEREQALKDGKPVVYSIK
jgi:hypothetical protein